MKKELIIDQPGLFLRLTGIAPFRTPAIIDITKLNINLLLSELNMNSVTEYKIISKIENKKKDINKPISKVNNIENKEDTSNVKKELDEIKSLLKNLLDKPSANIENYEPVSKSDNKKIRRKINISDDFIPKVNLDNLELKHSNTETIKSDIDISENVDLLSKMNKKKEI